MYLFIKGLLNYKKNDQTLTTYPLCLSNVCITCTVLGSTTVTRFWHPYAINPCHPLQVVKQDIYRIILVVILQS